MNINITRTADKKYYLHDDRLDAGAHAPLNINMSGGLQKNNAASYLISGRLRVINPNRPPQEYLPSHRRIGSGIVFPGQYELQALETSRVRCFHLTNTVDKDDYELEEYFLIAGETVLLSLDDGVEAGAIMVGEVEVNNVVQSAAHLIDVRDGDVNLLAVTDATVAVCRRKTASGS